MKVINLYGGPGSGKSTTAAGLFSKLKQEGYNVALVTEFAKDATYERRYTLLKNQLYILAKQYKRLKDIQEYGGVDAIITDSPLKLSFFYGKELPYIEHLEAIVNSLYNEFDNCDIFINRVKTYNPSGRNQTEEEAKGIDSYLRYVFNHDIYVDGDKNAIDVLYPEIVKFLKCPANETRLLSNRLKEILNEKLSKL